MDEHQNPLPQQRKITDEEIEEKKPSRVTRILLRVLVGVLALVAACFAYVFLLMGEPEEDAADVPAPTQARITVPMNPLEAPGESNLASLADTFDQPILYLYNSGLSMQGARIFDTAFGGGYARRVTLTYAFPDGALLTVESLRPTEAASLLHQSGDLLGTGSLYTLGGVDAARMENSSRVCIFGSTDAAVYAVNCPASKADELSELLRQTALMQPPIPET